MRGFVLGLVVAGLGFGAYMYWKQRFAPRAPGPVATAPAAPSGKEGREKKKRRRRGATRLVQEVPAGGASDPRASSPVSALDPEPEPVKLTAADLRLVSQGDDLGRPDVVHMDMSDDSGTHELSQDEIDARFRVKEEAILSCIARARPDDETYVPGRVTVNFRIQRTGNVRGVKVEAPAILQRGGIYSCIRGVVVGIRFPPSNGSQIVSYPFSLT